MEQIAEMEMRRTSAVGTKRTWSRVKCRPFATMSGIEPMPTAWMEDPPTPLIVRGGIGRSDQKSDSQFVMWTDAPLSRKKGVTAGSMIVPLL